MSNYSIHTNKLNTVSIIVALLICGFVYGCSNAKGKKLDNGKKAVKSSKTTTHQSHNTQAKEVAKQTDPQSSTDNPQSPKEKKRKITKNWKTFFSGDTKTQVRVHLLQHGQKYKKALKKFSQSKMAQQAGATISGIKLTSDTTAKVSYAITIGGAPVLKNRTGKALYINGTWKVDDAAFCSLIKLGGNLPKPCPGSSSQSSK